MPNIKWTTLLNIHGPSKGTLERRLCLFYFIKNPIIFKTLIYNGAAGVTTISILLSPYQRNREQIKKICP